MSANAPPDPLDEDFGPDAGLEPEDPFTWVIEGKVVAMGRPVAADLAALGSRGVHHVISLTLQPLPEPLLAEAGITDHHIPLADMSAPSVEDITRFVGKLSSLVESGRKVAVHCGAGLGRTGTMLACYLVKQGLSAREAIAQVRKRRPGSVESPAQEQAVLDYERHLSTR